ncbi:N/A [soil metagenome]
MRSITILIPFALLAVAGCSKATPAPASGAAAPSSAPVPISVIAPVKKTISFTVEQPGTVMAYETTPIVAKLPGYVAKVLVDMGDVVKEGQPLAEIAIPELTKEAEQKKAMAEFAAAEKLQSQASVEVAVSQVASAEALVNEAKAGLSRAQADYDRWDSELKRMTELVKNKVIDTQTLDETKKQFRSAAAARDESTAKVITAEQVVIEMKAKLLRAKSDVTAMEAKVKLAVADAERVAALVSYTTIKAPYAGVVTSRKVHTGHFLQTSADPLFTVARLDTVRVFVEVPESAAESANIGATVTVRIPSLNNRDVNGTVTRTSQVLNPDSRTLRVEIDLPNKDGSLRPGTYAVVKIKGTVTDAMTLPTTAVLFADETAYCFQVTGSTVVKRRLQIGRTDGGSIQIVGTKAVSGTASEFIPLKGEERIVTGNLGGLADGQAVEVKK